MTWWQIDYNGNYGVEVQMDNGKTIKVAGYLHDFNKRLQEALASKEE